MEPQIAILALGVFFLAIGTLVLIAFDEATEKRIEKLENIHRRGNWHDD